MTKKNALAIGSPRSRLFQYHGSAKCLIPTYNRSAMHCGIIVVSCRNRLQIRTVLRPLYRFDEERPTKPSTKKFQRKRAGGAPTTIRSYS